VLASQDAINKNIAINTATRGAEIGNFIVFILLTPFISAKIGRTGLSSIASYRRPEDVANATAGEEIVASGWRRV
jgi:hypothetical protein